MEDKQFEIISRKIDNITKLLAFDTIKDKTVNEQVSILTRLGFKASEIAQILDKTENQIYVTMNLLRKSKKKETAKEVTNDKQDALSGESSQ